MWALLADRVGRKPIFVMGVIGSSLLMFPYLGAVSSGNWVLVFLLGAVLSGVFYSMANGIWPSFYAEMFPTRVRVSGLALGTQIGFAISGGVTPFLATAVAGAEGDAWLNVALVVCAAGLISVIAALTAKETKSRSLRNIDDLHTSRTEALEVVALGKRNAAGR